MVLLYYGNYQMQIDERRKEFEELTRPLIKWMNENYHPMTTVNVSCTHAELAEGLIAFVTNDYIKD